MGNKILFISAIAASSLLAAEVGVYSGDVKLISDYPFADKKALSKSMGGSVDDVKAMKDGAAVLIISPPSSKSSTSSLNGTGQDYRAEILKRVQLLETSTLSSELVGTTLNTTEKQSIQSIFDKIANCNYSCQTGFVLGSGIYCYKPSICSTGVLTGSSCALTTTSTVAANNAPTYACNSGGILNGINCDVAATGYPVNVSQSYSCPSGGTLAGTTCTTTSTSTYAATATPVYSCPAGGTLSGSICTVTSNSTYAASATLSGYSISGSSLAYNTSSQFFGLEKSGNSFRARFDGGCVSGWGYLNTAGSFALSNMWCVNSAGNWMGMYNASGGIVAKIWANTTGAVIYKSGSSITGSSLSPAGTYGYFGMERLDGNSFRMIYPFGMTPGAAISWVPFYSGYTCPSGGTISGTTCTTTSSSTYAATNNPTYSCSAGDTLSGTACSRVTSSSYVATATPVYTCPSGGTLYGSVCQTSAASTYAATKTNHYSCGVGYTLSGSTCSKTTTTNTAPICSIGTFNTTEGGCVVPKTCNR